MSTIQQDIEFLNQEIYYAEIDNVPKTAKRLKEIIKKLEAYRELIILNNGDCK